MNVPECTSKVPSMQTRQLSDSWTIWENPRSSSPERKFLWSLHLILINSRGFYFISLFHMCVCVCVCFEFLKKCLKNLPPSKSLLQRDGQWVLWGLPGSLYTSTCSQVICTPVLERAETSKLDIDSLEASSSLYTLYDLWHVT